MWLQHVELNTQRNPLERRLSSNTKMLFAVSLHKISSAKETFFSGALFSGHEMTRRGSAWRHSSFEFQWSFNNWRRTLLLLKLSQAVNKEQRAVQGELFVGSRRDLSIMDWSVLLTEIKTNWRGARAVNELRGGAGQGIRKVVAVWQH